MQKINLTQKLDSEPRGNTRSRGWAVTIFDSQELELFKALDTQYKIYGEETCPTTGKKHFQSYCYFKNPRSFTSMKKKLPTSHIEKAKGNAKHNFTYCSKDGKYIEEGEMPTQGKPSASKLKYMTNEEIIDMNPRCWRAYATARDELNMDIDVDEWEKKVEVVYIQGESGVGKTEMAKQLVREKADTYGRKINVVKYENNFWSGIGNADVAIYDDFRDSHMKPSEFINFVDYNTHRMNIKGSCKINKFKYIIITSVMKLEEIYRNVTGEPRAQWMRRIKVIDLYKKQEPEKIKEEIIVPDYCSL